MPQHADGTTRSEQLDLLAVAGQLDLDGLEQLQRRLDEMPGGGRAGYAAHGVERSPATALGLGFWVYPEVFSAPDPGGQPTNRRAGVVSDTITAAGAGAHRVHQ